MKKKEYKLKTIEDIFEAVNENNIDGFLKDFETWLRLAVGMKKMGCIASNFRWRDDGDYGTLKELKIIIETQKGS